MKHKFIKTSDSAVADELRKNGFTELAKEGVLFVFLNNGKEKFSESENKKMIYTDNIVI